MGSVSTIEQPLIQVVTMGERGQRGVAGPPGSSAQPQISAQNSDAAPLVHGQPLYMKNDGTVGLADAATAGRVIGFCAEDTIPSAVFGLVQTDGSLDCTLAEWQVVIGSPGGLSPGTRYFLGLAPGTITATPDINAIVAFVGRAASATRLVVDIDPPIFP
jgi:hypothetical protein